MTELQLAQIKKVIEEKGLKLENANISFEGGKLSISGTAEDEAMKGKILAEASKLPVTVEDKIEIKAPVKTYTVKSGDSLSKIAKEFYGDAMQYPKIFDANRNILDDPNKIFPGQELVIPE